MDTLRKECHEREYLLREGKPQNTGPILTQNVNPEGQKSLKPQVVAQNASATNFGHTNTDKGKQKITGVIFSQPKVEEGVSQEAFSLNMELERARKAKDDIAKQLEKAELEAAAAEMKNRIAFLHSMTNPNMTSNTTNQTGLVYNSNAHTSNANTNTQTHSA